MAREQRILVRGKQRADVDVTELLEILLSIQRRSDEGRSRELPDTFNAAVEDLGAGQ